MKKTIGLLALLLAFTAHAHAQAPTDELIEIQLDRKSGDQPVYIRAILTRPSVPADTALLFFRGVPGYALIRSEKDKRRNLGWMGKGRVQELFMEAGIAFVIMDCPTDQWGGVSKASRNELSVGVP